MGFDDALKDDKWVANLTPNTLYIKGGKQEEKSIFYCFVRVYGCRGGHWDPPNNYGENPQESLINELNSLQMDPP